MGILKITIILGFMSILGGCRQDGFTPQERKIIGSPRKGVMHLYTVDVPREDSLLRERAQELTFSQTGSKTFAALYGRMLATVNDPDNPGVGIAAPQVGISRRFILVQRFDKEGEPFEFYINPVIEEYADSTATGREGCLSVPGRSGDVKRSAAVTVSWLDPANGERVSERVEGFTAIIFQHETDHLDGIIYTDRQERQAQEGA